MLFVKAVSAIVSGLYANFSARHDNYTAVCLLVDVKMPNHANLVLFDSETSVPWSKGSTIRRHYHCSTQNVIRKSFGLDKWNHTQTIHIESDDHVNVTDELLWPSCAASHQYTLSKKVGEKHGIRRSDTLWHLTCSSKTMNFIYIRKKMAAILSKTDAQVFDMFLDHIAEDNDKDGSSDESCSEDTDREEGDLYQLTKWLFNFD